MFGSSKYFLPSAPAEFLTEKKIVQTIYSFYEVTWLVSAIFCVKQMENKQEYEKKIS